MLYAILKVSPSPTRQRWEGHVHTLCPGTVVNIHREVIRRFYFNTYRSLLDAGEGIGHDGHRMARLVPCKVLMSALQSPAAAARWCPQVHRAGSATMYRRPVVIANDLLWIRGI